MDYVIPNATSPTLTDLNNKSIEKLYDLIDSLDAKSDPEMVRACVESLARLNSSLKGSNIIPQGETSEERQQREAAAVLEAEIG